MEIDVSADLVTSSYCGVRSHNRSTQYTRCSERPQAESIRVCKIRKHDHISRFGARHRTQRTTLGTHTRHKEPARYTQNDTKIPQGTRRGRNPARYKQESARVCKCGRPPHSIKGPNPSHLSTREVLGNKWDRTGVRVSNHHPSRSQGPVKRTRLELNNSSCGS